MAEVKIYNAATLEDTEWRELQGIQRQAFWEGLDLDLDSVDTLVDWNNPERFVASHLDPNAEVGQRFNSNQAYTRPKVAVATEAGEPIGFAYSAHNVSGSTELQRTVKRLTVAKNYLWLREIAVQPKYFRHGIAMQLGKKLLRHAIPLQPVAAYVWPELTPFMQPTLERIGLVATDEQDVHPFGEDSEAVKQVRMQARSVRTVLKNFGFGSETFSAL